MKATKVAAIMTIITRPSAGLMVVLGREGERLRQRDMGSRISLHAVGVD